MDLTKKRRVACLSSGVIVLVLAAGAGWADDAPETDPMTVLASMSAHLNSLTNITLSFDSDIEVITTELEKIQFTSLGTATIQRHDKIHARRVGVR